LEERRRVASCLFREWTIYSKNLGLRDRPIPQLSTSPITQQALLYDFKSYSNARLIGFYLFLERRHHKVTAPDER
jgi:hypothetical protein